MDEGRFAEPLHAPESVHPHMRDGRSERARHEGVIRFGERRELSHVRVVFVRFNDPFVAELHAVVDDVLQCVRSGRVRLE